MNYFLGIDTSTTGSKALLIDEHGEVVATASSPHTLQTPRPLWSEQDPHEWWGAVTASIKSVLESAGIGGERIGAVGLTGQMHGLVLLDEAGKVLRPAILWNDQRTQSQCDEIHARIGKEKFIQITGNVALTGFTASLPDYQERLRALSIDIVTGCDSAGIAGAPGFHRGWHHDFHRPGSTALLRQAPGRDRLKKSAVSKTWAGNR